MWRISSNCFPVFQANCCPLFLSPGVLRQALWGHNGMLYSEGIFSDIFYSKEVMNDIQGSTQEGVSAGYYIGVVQEDMVYGKCFFYVCVPSVYGFVGTRDVRMDGT